MGWTRNMYASEMLDDIFIYFMRTILHLQESGIEKLPLKQNFTEPVHTYLNLAMDFIIEGEMPETSELILKSEYDKILKNCDCNTELLLCLNMIRELSCHIHYDADMCDYIFNIRKSLGKPCVRICRCNVLSKSFNRNAAEASSDRTSAPSGQKLEFITA